MDYTGGAAVTTPTLNILQGRRPKRSKRYLFKGRSMIQWADELGVKPSEVHKRFYYHRRMGLTPHEALKVTVHQLEIHP